jgi:hypothetical protein
MLKPLAHLQPINHLPPPGTIGYVRDGLRRTRWNEIFWWKGKPRRATVESYPLRDRRGCRMTHCLTVRFLDNRERLTISRIHFAELEDL